VDIMVGTAVITADGMADIMDGTVDIMGGTMVDGGILGLR
jgi:hypothetical protein